MLFIDNKYTKWYNSIISNAQSRTEITGYTEKHHIVPKSLGGSNNSNNLVVLTAKEHFVCHLLLTKMVISFHRRSMAYALLNLRNAKNKHQQRLSNSKEYKVVREIFNSTEIKESTRQKLSQIHKGVKKSPEHVKKMSVNAKRQIRLPKSEESKNTTRQSLMGKNKGNKAWNTGIKRPDLVTCVYCKKTMATANFYQWHNGKCNQLKALTFTSG